MRAHSCGSDPEEIYEGWRRRRRGSSFKVNAGALMLSCRPFKGGGRAAVVAQQDERRLVVAVADAVDPAALMNGQQELRRLPIPAAAAGVRRRPGKQAPAVGVRRRAAGPCMYGMDQKTSRSI